MPELAVNVDHIATLRQARGVSYPEPAAAAALAELAGANGVVVHLRGDRRHIQDRDVRILRQTVQTRLTLEMAATPEMLEIAVDIQPDAVTLVPEKDEEITTEGGLDVIAHNVSDELAALKKAGIKTCVFIDPDVSRIKAAGEAGAEMVEIHTGAFCDAQTRESADRELEKIARAAEFAVGMGLVANAGHGIGYETVMAFRGMGIHEFSIGHSIVSRASLVGMDRAVRDMLALIDRL
ncbi:pyridoxine 5'-phosphate synthase [Candidatus Desulfarcum epimagneticum]|uniref:Pyridoxine 5'-phosphate synthase n=1 Tax=uncultured Desulfobacteraceae bacterium TaxID=218296 RepID=A0A484HQ46_9BACT|nr:pyridoxine 5'-phosphate synthase [uncultured Desulfobacteraceae bacterium]